MALLSISFPDHTKRASTIIPLGRPSNVSAADFNMSAANNTFYNNNPITTNISNATNISNTNNSHANNINNAANNKNGFPISFVHLGKQSSGGPMTLYATTLASRKQWAEKIEGQRKALVEKHKVFNIQPINENFFSAFNKVNCTAVFGKFTV